MQNIYLIIIGLVICGVVIVNKILERRERIDFIILDSLISGDAISIQEILVKSGSDRELIESNFYKVVGKLLRKNLIISCIDDGDLIVDRQVLYKITKKGKRSHFEYLDWQLDKVRKQKCLYSRSGSLDKYEIASDRELKLRNKLLETHCK